MDAFLKAIKECALDLSSVLDLGCGTGLHFKAIKEAFPNACLYGCDHSEAMIARAQQHGLAQGYLVCDVLSLKQSFDLILSHFSLHWMQPVYETVEHLLKQASYVAFCVPLEGSFSSWHTLIGPEVSLMPLMKKSDFSPYQDRVIFEEFLEYPMEFSTPLEFARYLKNLGAHYAPKKQLKIFKDPRWRQGPFETSYKVLHIILKGDL